jgi:hypothetical protein
MIPHKQIDNSGPHRLFNDKTSSLYALSWLAAGFELRIIQLSKEFRRFT